MSTKTDILKKVQLKKFSYKTADSRETITEWIKSLSAFPPIIVFKRLFTEDDVIRKLNDKQLQNIIMKIKLNDMYASWKVCENTYGVDQLSNLDEAPSPQDEKKNSLVLADSDTYQNDNLLLYTLLKANADKPTRHEYDQKFKDIKESKAASCVVTLLYFFYTECCLHNKQILVQRLVHLSCAGTLDIVNYVNEFQKLNNQIAYHFDPEDPDDAKKAKFAIDEQIHQNNSRLSAEISLKIEDADVSIDDFIKDIRVKVVKYIESMSVVSNPIGRKIQTPSIEITPIQTVAHIQTAATADKTNRKSKKEALKHVINTKQFNTNTCENKVFCKHHVKCPNIVDGKVNCKFLHSICSKCNKIGHYDLACKKKNKPPLMSALKKTVNFEETKQQQQHFQH